MAQGPNLQHQERALTQGTGEAKLELGVYEVRLGRPRLSVNQD